MKLARGMKIVGSEQKGAVLIVKIERWYALWLFVKLHTIHALLRVFRLKRLWGYGLRESE